jgi:hypothetical protein
MFVANISRPAAGSVVGARFTLTGTVHDDGTPSGLLEDGADEVRVLGGLQVRIGSGPAVHLPVVPSTGNWSYDASLPAGTSGGDGVTVTLTGTQTVANAADATDERPLDLAPVELRLVAATTRPRVAVDPLDAPAPAAAIVTPLDLAYTPVFHHANWVNNIDRIQGGGPNGFNVRFDAIESDLAQAATVVTQISTALSQVGVIGTQVLTPGLDLVSLPLAGTGGWSFDSAGVAHPDAGSGGGTAVMGLSLPDGVRLVSLRALGRYAGSPARFDIRLSRTELADTTKTDLLAELSDTSPGVTDPLDVTKTVTADFATVDNNTFRYYLLLGSSFITTPSVVGLSSIQIAYLG